MNATLKEITQVTCAVIIDKNKVLAALRSRQMSNSWKWEFPGGKIDAGETAEECIVREIKEELSVEIRIQEKLTPITYAYPDKTIELIPYICQIIGGKLLAVEHEKVCWFTAEELKSLNWADADVQVMQEYLTKI
ncbi:MAG: (deoxy)nucleoside triphosphate pyrophosphohydrolase [Carboxylicivirga sp.]|jgi:8-oxo-dGTP diphosphatase|nr:(deoxy)nucleoside triphosphate pyrophosphohydrolase [Carboxylicivirga sp.]